MELSLRFTVRFIPQNLFTKNNTFILTTLDRLLSVIISGCDREDFQVFVLKIFFLIQAQKKAIASPKSN